MRRRVALGSAIAAGLLGASALTGCASATGGGAATLSPSAGAAPASTGTVDASERELTLEIGEAVFREYVASADALDVSRFTAVTCSRYITDQISLRQTVDTADLLDAFMESRGVVQAQDVTDMAFVGVEGTGSKSGNLLIEATIKDNVSVPPVTARRGAEFPMVYEAGVWKVCPTGDPI